MISLLKDVSSSMRWFFSVGAKLARVVPYHTLLVVLFTLVSQISIMLAFLLPLKVIMLLGSSGIPRYFPRAFLDLDRDLLVVGLSITAVVFYVVYLLAEKAMDYWSDCGAQYLLQKSQKITLFENQVELATSSYKRYARCLAGGIFAGLAFILLGIIYPSLALLVLGYIAVICVFIVLLHSTSRSLYTKMENDMANLLDSLGAVGFLLSFAFLVVDFLFGSPPNLTFAIISVILVRRALGTLRGLTKDLIKLSKNRLRISALFFHGQALLEEHSSHDHGFWSLLDPMRRENWVASVLREVAGVKAHRLEVAWHQTGITNVAALYVQTLDMAAAPTAKYFVKLFNIKRQGQAVHEATLLTALRGRGLPVPRFIGASQVEGYTCHVFEVTGVSKPQPEEVKAALRFLLAELWAFEPPGNIVNRFRRSRPLLAQRLKEEMKERLLLVAEDPATVADVASFVQSLPVISEILSALPLCIYNRDLGADSLLKLEDKRLVATHWGRWSLEPVGAGWPLREQDWEALPSCFAGATEKRPALAGVTIEEARLAALIFAFISFYERQSYVSAIELLPEILECVESAQGKLSLIDEGRGVCFEQGDNGHQEQFLQ